MPPPAMTWSSAATEDSATQNVEPATRIALHAFIFSSFSALLLFVGALVEMGLRRDWHRLLVGAGRRLEREAARDLVEEVVHRPALRDQSLPVRIVDRDLEVAPIGFETERRGSC